MEWSPSLEQLLAKYCDESQVRESLHRKAYYFYKKLLSWFQIPIIVGSALSGSLQFLSKSFPDIENHMVTGTASLSIMVSLLSAVMSYLKIGESMTKNEISLVEWQNFHNTLQHQLSLQRHDRLEPAEFMKWVKAQYDRLFEISPVCNQKFITQTKKKIRKIASGGFQIPNYLNGFEHATIWREPPEDDEKDFEDNSIDGV
jgi:hypothetical protein